MGGELTHLKFGALPPAMVACGRPIEIGEPAVALNNGFDFRRFPQGSRSSRRQAGRQADALARLTHAFCKFDRF